ncbi:MAG: AzlC family ABC transporter permease, partial [Campylobacteraceae bacterium]|nr:AzlC family ABC transporter permease [Campylobacteraceae bacterium]
MNFLSILRLTFPVLLGYVPLGITFGLLAVSADIPWYYAMLMSVFIFAGSGQFLAITLFASQATYLEIFVALFLVNLRHFFYGISMLNDFKILKGFAKKYSIFALTDETFALLKTTYVNKEDMEKTFVSISALNQFYWIFGTFVGAYLGANINFNFDG